jgi:hypothetical protein
MLQIIRIERPTLEQFKKAALVCEERWEDTKPLNRKERFEVFQRLDVELVLAQDEKEIQAVCFLLPDKFWGEKEEQKFVWLFQVASRLTAKSTGVLMLLRAMQLYPAMMGIGITEQAERLYQTLGWKKYNKVWRCVHPINLNSFIELYKDRIKDAKAVIVLKALGTLYNISMMALEKFISYTLPMKGTSKINKIQEQRILLPNYEYKVELVSSYLNVFRIGKRILEAVEITGKGRIVRDDAKGFERLKAHIMLWHELRKNKVIYNEFIATSERARKEAFYCGYFPLRMPIYFYDKFNKLNYFFDNLHKVNFTFASCDKIL